MYGKASRSKEFIQSTNDLPRQDGTYYQERRHASYDGFNDAEPIQETDEMISRRLYSCAYCPFI